MIFGQEDDCSWILIQESLPLSKLADPNTLASTTWLISWVTSVLRWSRHRWSNKTRGGIKRRKYYQSGSEERGGDLLQLFGIVKDLKFCLCRVDGVRVGIGRRREKGVGGVGWGWNRGCRSSLRHRRSRGRRLERKIFGWSLWDAGQMMISCSNRGKAIDAFVFLNFFFYIFSFLFIYHFALYSACAIIFVQRGHVRPYQNAYIRNYRLII